MLITPRTYSASQSSDQGAAVSRVDGAPRFYTLAGWRQRPVDARATPEMLLVHQVGSVRVGEVVRYTVTYTPAADPILPIPSELHVRVKNTSAIPLRAAYLHGPYTLYASCYPSTYDPNSKYDRQRTEGVPQFEPYLKAGGNWDATIKMPVHFGDRHSLAVGHLGPDRDRSVTWVIEIVSQVIFSSSAAVHFELLIARDMKALEFFSASGSSSNGTGPPGKLQDHWPPGSQGQRMIATKGVYSKSTTVSVDDTSSLWNSPPLPSAMTSSFEAIPDVGSPRETTAQAPELAQVFKNPPQKQDKMRVHLVVLTHGLHSNLGADMLYLKESIDAAAKKASSQGGGTHEDEEHVVVRGFSGNAVRTERGIQYLGKRLAKYVLLMTYPDQQYFPLKSSKSKSFTRPFNARKEHSNPTVEPHFSTAPDDTESKDYHAYQITSISFIGHSLGGLIQTYAIAYIQKHSPEFFDRIKPINFIALATPFLGLSNENPMYVRFALDLGLVGRTGQDLGLSWTAPKVRSGWGAIIGGRGDSTKDQSNTDPGAKPLLRILPCGPAHQVLHKFHHRTLYSNVVNDGIVPLRTSCLLFLDWRGLDRVEKARRDNGLVGTMAEWGWAELTGANSKSPRLARSGELPTLEYASDISKDRHEGLSEDSRSSREPEDAAFAHPSSPIPEQVLAKSSPSLQKSSTVGTTSTENIPENNSSSPLATFLSLFRTKEAKPAASGKHQKIYKRSQTLGSLDASESPASLLRGNPGCENDGVHTPPKTTLFESAGDLLMPPLPPTDFVLDPAARPRTIFHDRVYHPEDVPPPVPTKRRTLAFGSLQNKNPKATPLLLNTGANGNQSESGLKVEEKIARAYHRDLTWRKVLVRLEPDAHNNIIVRRMFTNAYGWPVVKHLVDTHFGSSPSVEIDDTLKTDVERAKPPGVGPTSSGDEVEGQSDAPEDDPTEAHGAKASPLHVLDDLSQTEARLQIHTRFDTFPAEHGSHTTTSTNGHSHYTGVSRQDSARWTDRQVDEDNDCESGLDEEDGNAGYRWAPAYRAA
ncbi:uncharacterized protein N7459_000772 [Penicillium hispanicum]|uniref:uncharacterized protein n=1 Tax=Penicillium hispanicum TaxID=1080232 RepID=UPI00254194EF|nr:uncharacterized protein N7459_000772 [Penicillium hispanicum]KAJ5594564.1 hypothetical protein N7459_000772 [Penicillium hispanicum]